MRVVHCCFPKAIVLVVIILLVTMISCAMLLQPTTSFDRRRIARGYGKILCQSNPDCENCTDQFVVEEKNGHVITLVIKYDGRIRVIE